MSQILPADIELSDFHNSPIRAAGEDRRGVRRGLSVAGGCLGGAVALLAVLATGVPNDSPVGWLAVACAAAIGAVLGA
jgi:hypothetical protein